ncbi:hypothetical protein NPIL_14921 [Nephila pilipes]|uniref:Secreted protein n=1 Tax=Nephila pilipes TaxID=299642 RepID=A0A8X6UIT7_NEPPI|nr:hypothetical protein NPIL_14921 [Nephila pilipes]
MGVCRASSFLLLLRECSGADWTRATTIVHSQIRRRCFFRWRALALPRPDTCFRAAPPSDESDVYLRPRGFLDDTCQCGHCE